MNTTDDTEPTRAQRRAAARLRALEGLAMAEALLAKVRAASAAGWPAGWQR